MRFFTRFFTLVLCFIVVRFSSRASSLETLVFFGLSSFIGFYIHFRGLAMGLELGLTDIVLEQVNTANLNLFDSANDGPVDNKGGFFIFHFWPPLLFQSPKRDPSR